MKDRILQLIEHLNVSVREFEIKCGLSNGYVKAMRKSLGVDKLENVLKAYPNVNRDWLISGEGTMLRTDATSESREEAEMEATDLVRELRRQLEEERRKNEELQKKTDAQQSTINSMAKTMEMMMEEKQKSICG